MRRHHSWLALIQRLADVVAAVAVLYLLCDAFQVAWTRPYAIAAILAGAFTMIAMQGVNAYRAWRGATLWAEARTVIAAWILIILMLLLVAWATKSTAYFSRLAVGSWFIVSPLVMVALHFAGRLLLRQLRRHGRNMRSAVVVGGGHLGQRLIDRFGAADWMGVRVLAVFDDDTTKHGSNIHGVQVIGSTDALKAYVTEHNIDLVYLALPMRAEERMRILFDALQDTTASVYLVPDLFVFELMGARAQDIDGIPVFALCETPFFGPFGVLKRVEDIVLSTAIIVLTAPLMLLVAVAVKFASPGPVLFKQRRYGLNGQEMLIWKFRTMTVCEDGPEVRQAQKNDARVTAVGTWLRRFSLDELPQFFNVLQGRMSIVGPRPHAVAHNELYRKLIRGYMWRHKVRPGITGWAQINGWRGETDTLGKMEKRVEFDLDYISNWSVWLDMKIIALTVITAFREKNAY